MDSEDRWQWLEQAHQVIADWESGVSGRMLSVIEATMLAEEIASALKKAFDEGRSSGPEAQAR